GLHAPRLSPGPLYTPRNVSLVGLARTGVIPQNNSTSDCYFYDPVVLALRAGQIDGQSQAKGIRIPLSGLLIGVSALELGYEVGTANVRHSQLIPGLNVVQP
ncbi:MAG TPA: hypothetical protein VK776_01045, partial [Bryobacteraceae bacterium]|nr:hypothetical protein [Bryobacteraceae bacterium]